MVTILKDLKNRVAWAITKFKEKTKFSLPEIGEILSVDKNTVAGYRKKEGLIKGVVLEKLISNPYFSFSALWLMENRGEPFPGAREEYPEVCGPEEDTSLYNKVEDLIDRVAEPVAEYGGGVDDFGKAAAGLKEIFDSHDPVLIPAIQSNIRAFQISVRRERHIQQQANKISALEEENASIKSRLDTIEKRLPPPGENIEKKVM